MACTDTINEGSSKRLTVEFLDDNGLPMIPAAATYEVLCMTTETVVMASTAISPLAASVEIQLDTAINTLVDRVTNEREKRRVIVTSENANAEPYVDAYDYYLKRLKP